VGDPSSGIVRFGSLTVRLHADRPFWAGALVRRFRARVEPAPGSPLKDIAGVEPDVILDVRNVAGGPPAAAPAGDDALRMERSGGRVRVLSDLMTLEANLATRPARAEIAVHAHDRADGVAHPDRLEHYFAVYIHKLLQLFGIVRLHGAAVELDGVAQVFLGDKGAGKSTIALALGQAGGRVLADDQIAIRRTGAGAMAVSGCDGNIRLTEPSERHFLDAPLAARPQDFAGVMKKEVALDGLVRAIPYEDRPAGRLYFPAVGRRFGVRPIPPRAAVVRILGTIVPAHRFVDAADRLDLIRLVTDFVEPLACADLELSPDLADLGQLVEHVGRRV
jgi:hypothetical protein